MAKSKLVIVVTSENWPAGVFTTKTSLKRWMDVNELKFHSWEYNGERAETEFTLVPKGEAYEIHKEYSVNYTTVLYTEATPEDRLRMD